MPVASNCFFQPTLIRFLFLQAPVPVNIEYSFCDDSVMTHRIYNKKIGDIWVAIEEQYKFTNPPRLSSGNILTQRHE